MNMRDIAKYASLLSELAIAGKLAYDIEERLRKNPPTDVEGFVKLHADLDLLNRKRVKLTKDIRAIVETVRIKPGDIEKAAAKNAEAHARNMQSWAEEAAGVNEVVPEVPPVTPAPAPTTSIEPFIWYTNPPPADDVLKEVFQRGTKWASADGTMWAVTLFGEAKMATDPHGNPPVEIGPIR